MFDGWPIEIADAPESIAATIIASELHGDCYGLNRIAFTPGRLIEMVTNPTNSGGSTIYSRTLRHERSTGIRSTTLDHIFDSLSIAKCKLLKIDCEGGIRNTFLNTQSVQS